MKSQLNRAVYSIFFIIAMFLVASESSAKLYLKNDSRSLLEHVKIEIKTLDDNQHPKQHHYDETYKLDRLKVRDNVYTAFSGRTIFFSRYIEVKLTAFVHIADNLYKKIDLYSQHKVVKWPEGKDNNSLTFYFTVDGNDFDNLQLHTETKGYGTTVEYDPFWG